jgi:peptidoglycan/LPS O-acetylase OafA/YrhL
MPALFVTLLFTSIVALAIFPKQMLSDFSESMFASSIYLSNAYFWSQTGYFDTASHLKPLLHTWSLSVEEQFYLFWPLFILVVVSLGKSRLVIFVVGLLSLVAAELLYDKGTSLTFFMFPFRIFEFAIGAFIFKSQLNKNKQSYSFLLSLLGWLFVIGSLFLLDDKDKMPGLLSLPICLGTALIIYSNFQFSSSNLLVKLGVRVGLISYSAYLIHWPLVVFYKFKITEHLRVLDTVLLIVTTLILAELMYRFVEQKTAKFSIQQPLKIYSWVLGISAFSLVYFSVSPKLYSFMSDIQGSVKAIVDNTESHKEKMARKSPLLLEYSRRKNVRNIVILGDSHSADLALAIGPYISDKVILLNNTCDPLSSNSLSSEDLDQHYMHHGNKSVSALKCRQYHNDLMSRIIKHKPDLVVFSERWRKVALPFLGQTVKDIKLATNSDVLIFGPNFELSSDVRVAFNGITKVDDINKHAKTSMKSMKSKEREVLRIAKKTNSFFISKIDIVCPQGACQLHDNTRLTYADSSHWSELGMSLYGEAIVKLPPFSNSTKSYYSNNLSNFGELDKLLGVEDFDNPRDFYLFARAKAEIAEQSETTKLVLGDISRVEIYSALNLKNNYIGVKEIAFSQNCAPVVALDNIDLLAELYNNQKHQKGKYDRCGTYHNNLLAMIKKIDANDIYLGYNWSGKQLLHLEKSIKIIKNETDANIYLFALKPRLIANKNNKIQFLTSINNQLKRLALKNNVIFVDTLALLCKGNLSEQCYNNIKEYYMRPNGLNIQGIKVLANEIDKVVKI